MTEVDIIATSPAILAHDGQYERKPRAGWRKRDAEFGKRFDRLTLFYDCFRATDNETVLLVGPPLRNIKKPLESAAFYVEGDGRRLTPLIHESLSVTIVELRGIAANAETVTIALGGQTFSLQIQSNYGARLSGKRVLFSMNLNNKAEWLSAWAGYHRRFHSIDAVILFDNGSTNLSLEQIGTALEHSGTPEVFVVPWDHPFGPIDSKVLFDPYWARFAQIGSMSVALRRFGSTASGLLNCDVDELVFTNSAPTMFEALEKTPHGLLIMDGIWIEADQMHSHFGDHRDFGFRQRHSKAHRCGQRKWVLDPRKPWVSDLGVHPYWHWIEGRPRGAKARLPETFYWHFKGINTNWKTERNAPGSVDKSEVEIDPDLIKLWQRWP